MTGGEILNRSLQLLGYGDGSGNTHLAQVIRNRAAAILNLVYAELSRNCKTENKAIKSLSDKVNLPDSILNEVMVCGVAMYIANAEGDANAEAFWGREYNAKRAAISRTESYKDTIPNVWGQI